MYKSKRVTQDSFVNFPLSSSGNEDSEEDVPNTLPPLNSNGFSLGIDTGQNFYSEIPKKILIHQNSTPFVVPKQSRSPISIHSKSSILSSFPMVSKLLSHKQTFV